jgi:hypothetical protein
VLEKVDALPGEREQLSPSQPGKGGHQDERPVSGLDGVGQGIDLRHRGDRPLPRPFGTGAPDGAGIADDTLLGDGCGKDAVEEPIGLGHRARTRALSGPYGRVPGSDRCW